MIVSVKDWELSVVDWLGLLIVHWLSWSVQIHFAEAPSQLTYCVGLRRERGKRCHSVRRTRNQSQQCRASVDQKPIEPAWTRNQSTVEGTSESARSERARTSAKVEHYFRTSENQWYNCVHSIQQQWRNNCGEECSNRKHLRYSSAWNCCWHQKTSNCSQIEHWIRKPIAAII